MANAMWKWNEKGCFQSKQYDRVTNPCNPILLFMALLGDIPRMKAKCQPLGEWLALDGLGVQAVEGAGEGAGFADVLEAADPSNGAF